MTDIDDTALDDFLRAFSQVAEQAGRRLAIEGPYLIGALREHLGVNPTDLAVVAERVERHRFADHDIAIERIAGGDPGHRLIGIGGGEQPYHQTLGDMLNNVWGGFPLAQVDDESVAVGPDATRKVVRFGLWLFAFDGAPVALLQRQANPRFGAEMATLEVLCPDPERVSALLEVIRRTALEHSILRGQVVSFEGTGYQAESEGFVFHARSDDQQGRDGEGQAAGGFQAPSLWTRVRGPHGGRWVRPAA